MNSRNKYLLFLIIIVVGVALDQWTKYLAVAHLKEHPSIQVVGNFFRLTYAENTGAFLSLGADWNPTLRLIVLTILPTLLLVGVMIYMLRSPKLRVSEATAFALIAAGGLGNIVDRILVKYVVDFMHMDFWGITQTGVFNVADMYIVAGIIVYAYAAFVRWREEKAAAADPS